MLRFPFAVATLALCGCTATVTSTKEDAFGGKFQSPFGWNIESGRGKSAILKSSNGAGTVWLHQFPQGASCESALRESHLKLNGIRPWKQQEGRTSVAVAGINDGETLGAALCEFTTSGTFVVAVAAPKSVWLDSKATLYNVAESYRRNDKPVFNAAPLRRVKPDGSIEKPKDD